MRKIAFSFISLLLFFIIIEVLFRIFLAFYNPNPQKIIDNKLGWKLKSNFSAQLEKKGIGTIDFSTYKYGFRRWGDINSTKEKILIIGDSYTEANQINNGKCYYDYLDSSKFEIFAYGCGGYGTLQEYLFIKPLLDEIKPDLIVWQHCHNDLINNSYVLEKQSLINNLLVRKPYLINNKIEYFIPNNYYFLGFIEQYSKSILWLHYKVNSYRSKYLSSIESQFDTNKPIFKESLNTTKLIYERVKNLKYPIVVFSVTTSYGYKEIQNICNDLELPYLNAIRTKLDSLSNNGIKLDLSPYDWHWNERGHKEAGKELNKEIDNYLKKKLLK